MPIRLTLFGAPAVAMPGRSVALPMERRGQLLAYLAFKRGWVSRAELSALLWPELPSGAAYANLRKTLHRLQQVDWAPALEAQAGALRVAVSTDVAGFEEALAAQRLHDAVALRQGELLAGFDDDASPAWSAWLAFERNRLREAWRDAALRHLAAGPIEPAAAIALATQLLEADPLDEAAVRAQLTWLARSGQTARARQLYREFTARLQAELELAPSAELKALHDALGSASASTPGPSPPVAAAAAGPAAGSAFVGRNVERKQIADLLAQDECRLLCLLGPGGVGKTRLARQAMGELAARFADGAALIPLEDLNAADEIGPRLARELGVPPAGNRDPLEQVIAALGPRRMLLVLDNLEQLAAGAAVVERLLQGCPGLKLIVTSRVRLALAAEWLLPVDGLPCPEPEDADRVESFDAARLFIKAAQRVAPALEPAAEAAAIVDICRLTGGLPLVLELAAGWTRLLSCAAIAAELQQGTELLRAVDATQPPRHASIQAVFDQSWRLLSAAERDVLARLAVFRGGCSVEAARAVAGAPLPVLGALVDKSLLRKDGARLSLHPLVQQMVEAMQPADGAVLPPARQAHAGYFHRLLRQLRRGAENGERETLRRIDADLENCRAAWRWAVTHGEVDALAAGVTTLSQYFEHQCRFAEGLVLLNAALAQPEVQRHPGPQALLQAHAAHLESRRDRYAEAAALAAPALAAAQACQHREAELQCLRVLGTCALRSGRYDDAQRFYRRALQLAPATVDPQNAADMLNNLAVVASEQGRYDDTLRLAAQSSTLHHQIGDVAGEASGLQVLAITHMSRGEFEPAHAHLTAALALCERHGLVTLRASVLGALVDHARKSGDFAAAERYAQRALELAQAHGYRALTTGLKFDLVHIALHRGDLAAARTALGEGMRLAIAIARPTLQVMGVAWCAQILAAQGERECAAAVLRAAIAHPLAPPAEREGHKGLLVSWQVAESATAAVPGFEGLVQRIAAEAEVAFAPLLAALAAGGGEVQAAGRRGVA